ncbi:hypothetical protein Acsp04_03860 [Actinomadura sp. NBRC 104425]|uniref:hypothetical protein n=1 Tax=Actinomadura sp. NBRC 104425 TaxID=3032204 RepID=UPI0024A4C715|nr:hypothetical protein [Actinomadura sp. NBRC 104425]GLZ10151.1 hypothetical protein Acsp04_03860 [Actinomadura sp. NBRC 104425]
MLKKATAAAGLVIGAAAGALLLSSPAHASGRGDDPDVNAQQQKQAVSVTANNVNKNTLANHNTIRNKASLLDLLSGF